MSTLTQDLQRVLDVLTIYGWRQNEMGDPHRGYCLLGGMSAAIPGGPRRRRKAVYDAISRTLPRVTPIYEEGSLVAALPGHASLAVWNDAPGRSFEDVQLAIKLAIADADDHERTPR